MGKRSDRPDAPRATKGGPMKRPTTLVILFLMAGCSRDVPTGTRLPRTSALPAFAGASGSATKIIGSAGGGSLLGTAGTTSVTDNALTVHVEDIKAVRIELLTLACAGGCADIEAVASGGNAPYTFAWEDSSTSARRHVCLDADATLEVRTTDTAISTAEFGYAAHTAYASVAASVLDCPDGGTCDLGTGTATPKSGHYVGDLICGAGSYSILNGMHVDDASAGLGSITLDLAIDPGTAQQSGTVSTLAVGVLATFAKLDGKLDCGTFRGTLVDGHWGLPGATPETLISTGDFRGDLTVSAVPGKPDTITGVFPSKAYTGTSENGLCAGTFTAMLMPIGP
jgi:hypothetical protein